MPDPILLDTNILKDVARGNQSVADALRRYLDSSTRVYISRAAYDELVTGAKTPQIGGQYRQLLTDLHIEIAPPGQMRERVNLYADNIQHQPAPGKPGKITEYSSKSDPPRPGDVFVAAQAQAIGARLWTLDEDLAKRASHQGVKLAPECALKGIGGTENVAAARSRLGLKDHQRFDSKGNLLAGTIGASKGTGNGNGGLKAYTGVADRAPPFEPEPSVRGERFSGGMELLFQGINFALEKLNDNIQKKKVDAALKSIDAQVSQARQTRPEEGVLLIFNYTQMEAPDESLIKPGAVFQYVEWGQGYTREEAMRDALKTGSISGGGPNDKRSKQTVWLPPLKKPAMIKAHTPFPVVGRGRFPGGKHARLQLVEFTLGGFDDIVQKTIDLPNGRNAEFLILQPPKEVNYIVYGKMSKQRVPIRRCKSANDKEILAVDLDPSNPFDVCAVMCFPTDDWSEAVFKTVRATDGSGALAYLNFSMIRWIRPESIEVLEMC